MNHPLFSIRRLTWIVTVILILGRVDFVSAGSLSIREGMNLTTMAEVSAGALAVLISLRTIQAAQTVNFSGTYSDAGWTSSISGLVGNSPLTVNYKGNLSGDFGSPITVAFDGRGNVGTSPLSASGTTAWVFNAMQNDYTEMNFLQTGIDRRVLVGAEILVGGAVGGFVTRTWGGAGVGADVALTLSSILEAFIDPDLPLPQPSRPGLPPSTPTPTPPFPRNGLPPTPPGSGLPPSPPGSGLSPTSQVVTALYTDLDVLHHNHGNLVLLSAEYGGGIFSGSATVVPEPATLLLFQSGVLLLGVLKWILGARGAPPSTPTSVEDYHVA